MHDNDLEFVDLSEIEGMETYRPRIVNRDIEFVEMSEIEGMEVYEQRIEAEQQIEKVRNSLMQEIEAV